MMSRRSGHDHIYSRIFLFQYFTYFNLPIPELMSTTIYLRNSLTVLLFVICSSTFTWSQSVPHCGTDILNALTDAEFPEYAKQSHKLRMEFEQLVNQNSQYRSQGNIYIPVVFHVVYNTPVQNIPVSRLMEQLQVLNDDFNRMNADTANTPAPFVPCAATTGIYFCLAEQDPNGQPTTGILNVPTTVTSFTQNNNVKMSSMGGSDAWPTSQYMNVWVCNLSSGLLGNATYPGGNPLYDGVVLHYGAVGGPNDPGTTPDFNLGRVGTHEVGHWLNLAHFLDNCDTLNTNVCQPPQMYMPFGCPVFPDISCNNGPNGDMFMNFMQGVNDNCMNLFNLGQSIRMNLILGSLRSGLTTSLGCIPVGNNEPGPEQQFSVYPNPFSDELHLISSNSGVVEYSLTDISGRVVFSSQFNGSENINLKNLSDGIYFLQLVHGEYRNMRKLIKRS